jgi:hypothetical protein
LGALALADAAMAFESVSETIEPQAAIERVTELERLFAQAAQEIAAKLTSRSVAA